MRPFRVKGLDVTSFAKVAELTKKHSNLPERYIRRTLEEVRYQSPYLANYRQITVKRIKNHFDVHRSWEIQFQLENLPGKRNQKIYVEPIKDWSFFKGDRVEVLTGKDKGKQGIVCQVIQERNWVFVQGLNMYFKKLKPVKNAPVSLFRVEAPLLVTTDVALVDPSDLKPVKIKWRYTESGEKVRVSERTGRIIPIPKLEEETYDYKTISTYKEREKDTPAKEVTKITFVPSLQTFEMSIMEEMGIEEDREPAKVYWY